MYTTFGLILYLMKKVGYLIVFLIHSINGSSQDLFLHSDTLNNQRLIGVTSTVTLAWVGSMTALSQIWYKDIPKSKFHTFDDSKNWLQMDKVGHFYAAYKINHLTSQSFNWSGLDRKKSVWIGTGVSLGYQTTFELFDGVSQEWGFSWSDMGANALGSFSYLSQQLIWEEERIIPKFSSFPTSFAKIRPTILGDTFTESLLKDYNGQTYWLSISPGMFMKHSKIPKWASISIGYSVNAKLVGDESSYLDPITGINYQEQREFLLSLDIDFSQLPIKRPWLKLIVKQFNYLKIPFPALIYRGNQFHGSWTGW